MAIESDEGLVEFPDDVLALVLLPAEVPVWEVERVNRHQLGLAMVAARVHRGFVFMVSLEFEGSGIT